MLSELSQYSSHTPHLGGGRAGACHDELEAGGDPQAADAGVGYQTEGIACSPGTRGCAGPFGCSAHWHAAGRTMQWNRDLAMQYTCARLRPLGVFMHYVYGEFCD